MAVSRIRAIRALEADKKLPYRGEIPILALTADLRPQTQARAHGAGVTGFLTKPIHIPQMLGALSPIIEATQESLFEITATNRAA